MDLFIMNSWIGDLETDGLLDKVTQVFCGVFIREDGKQTLEFRPHQIKEMLQWMDTTEKIIFHGGYTFDWLVLKKLYDWEYKGIKEDTLVMSKLYKPNRFVPPYASSSAKRTPHSIEAWGYRLNRNKVEHNDWEKFSEEMLFRCREDVEIGRLTYISLLEEKAQYDWEHATYITNRAFEILGKTEEYGWKFDVALAHKGISMLTHWQERIDKLLSYTLPILCVCEERKVKGDISYVKRPFKKDGNYSDLMLKWLNKAGILPDDRILSGPFSRVNFRPVDVNKRKETVDFLLDSGWKPKEYNINDEGERTSPKLSKTDPFNGVEGIAGKLIAKYIQIRHRKSLIEGLLKQVRSDGRIPSRVSGLAVTGRMKHSIIVNIPNGEAFFGRWLRRLFICDEDKTIIGTDADGCQNRVIGGLVGDDNYTYALLHGTKESGDTVHLLNQNSLLKAGYDVPYGNCKNLNFAHFFGGGDTKLGKMVGGSKEDGARIRQALLDVAPGLEELLDGLREQWRQTAHQRPNKWGGLEYYNGWLKGLDKRPIFISSEHQILVYIVQAAEAILMTHALVFLYDWLISEGYKWGDDFGFLTFHHDEIDLECKPEHQNRISFLSEQAITEASKYLGLPIEQIGESKIGYNWYECH